jgi:hypothetical protein
MNDGSPPPVALLMQFGPKLVRHESLLVETLRSAWRNHPPIYVALPGASSASADGHVIACSRTGWVSMLRESLVHIKQRETGIRYLFSMIDDHCPLRICDQRRLEQIIRTAIAEEMKCVVFATYEWPWTITAENSVDELGRTKTWRTIDVLESNRCRFARVPKAFFRYNQCQPALWETDYYLSVCNRMLELGIDDPWEFESMLLPGQPQHYVSEYAWPSVQHGFMAKGRINAEAIHFVRGDSLPMKTLRKVLVQEYCRERGRGAYFAERLRHAFRPIRRLVRNWLYACGVLERISHLRARLRSNSRVP